MRGYNLSLSDGSGWWITSSGAELRCVDRLAAIMQLKECPLNVSPRLVFSGMEVDSRVRGNDILFVPPLPLPEPVIPANAGIQIWCGFSFCRGTARRALTKLVELNNSL